MIQSISYWNKQVIIFWGFIAFWSLFCRLMLVIFSSWITTFVLVRTGIIRLPTLLFPLLQRNYQTVLYNHFYTRRGKESGIHLLVVISASNNPSTRSFKSLILKILLVYWKLVNWHHHLGSSGQVASSAGCTGNNRVNNHLGHSMPGFLLHVEAGQLYSCLGTYPAREHLTCRESCA